MTRVLGITLTVLLTSACSPPPAEDGAAQTSITTDGKADGYYSHVALWLFSAASTTDYACIEATQQLLDGAVVDITFSTGSLAFITSNGAVAFDATPGTYNFTFPGLQVWQAYETTPATSFDIPHGAEEVPGRPDTIDAPGNLQLAYYTLSGDACP